MYFNYCSFSNYRYVRNGRYCAYCYYRSSSGIKYIYFTFERRLNCYLGEQKKDIGGMCEFFPTECCHGRRCNCGNFTYLYINSYDYWTFLKINRVLF